MRIQDIHIGNRFRKDVGDLTSLIKSIREVGLLHPIVVSGQGDLIAGYRRLKAFEQMGLEEVPATILNLDDLRYGERDENEVRLNLNPTEAVAVAEYFEPLIEKTRIGHRLSKEEEKKGDNSTRFPKGKTRSVVAKKTGYSYNTIKKAKAIVEAAEEEPEKYRKLQSEMDNGKRSVNSAFAQLKEAKRKEEINKKLEQINQSIPEGVTLIKGDFEQADIKPETIQLILTDPPYLEEFLSVWDKLATFAEKVLVKGGFLVAYCGHYHLLTVLNKLKEKLAYFWVIALMQKQNAIVQSRHVYCQWKPILVFYKPPLQLPAFFGDVIKGDGREKENHEWQQGIGELGSIIRTFSSENGLILDPLSGSGTTLVAANRQGRKVIGIELNQETFKTLKVRIAEECHSIQT